MNLDRMRGYRDDGVVLDGRLAVTHWDEALQTLVSVEYPEHGFQFIPGVMEDPEFHCHLCGATHSAHLAVYAFNAAKAGLSCEDYIQQRGLTI